MEESPNPNPEVRISSSANAAIKSNSSKPRLMTVLALASALGRLVGAHLAKQQNAGNTHDGNIPVARKPDFPN